MIFWPRHAGQSGVGSSAAWSSVKIKSAGTTKLRRIICCVTFQSIPSAHECVQSSLFLRPVRPVFLQVRHLLPVRGFERRTGIFTLFDQEYEAVEFLRLGLDQE